MKRILIGLLMVVSLFFAQSAQAVVLVNPTVTKNGTYIPNHYRSDPDGLLYNNWTTEGNTNPFTGKEGTVPYPTSYYCSPLVLPTCSQDQYQSALKTFLATSFRLGRNETEEDFKNTEYGRKCLDGIANIQKNIAEQQRCGEINNRFDRMIEEKFKNLSIEVKPNYKEKPKEQEYYTCPDNSTFNSVDKRCHCFTGYEVNKEGTVCQQIASKTCDDPFALYNPKTQICTCISGYLGDEITRRCLPEKEFCKLKYGEESVYSEVNKKCQYCQPGMRFDKNTRRCEIVPVLSLETKKIEIKKVPVKTVSKPIKKIGVKR